MAINYDNITLKSIFSMTADNRYDISDVIDIMSDDALDKKLDELSNDPYNSIDEDAVYEASSNIEIAIREGSLDDLNDDEQEFARLLLESIKAGEPTRECLDFIYDTYYEETYDDNKIFDTPENI